MISTDRLNIILLSDEEIQATIQGEPIPELRQAYSEMLDGSRAHPDMREWYAVWDIRLSGQPETTVGNLSFKGLTADGMAEIGYGISPEYEGRGYATEAVRAMVEWAAAQAGVKRIEAETELDNCASQRVLEKVGFVRTGEIGEEGPRYYWKSKGEGQIEYK